MSTTYRRPIHPPTHRSKFSSLDELAGITAQMVNELSPETLRRTSLKERRYWLLLRTNLVESWLIEWGSSAFLGLHDHGGSRGAFQVVAGELIEVSTSLTSRAPLSSTVLGANARRAVAPDVVHEMWNPGESSAWTVHTYSPPLSSMTFYEHTAAQYLEPISTQTEMEWSRRSEMTVHPEVPLDIGLT